MKKELWVFLLLTITVMLMSVAVRVRDNPSDSIKSFFLSRLTDTDTLIKHQVPILAMAESQQTMIHEEDEDTDPEIKIEIDSSYISPAVPKGNARILIYHTHINEAYAQTESYTYTETGSFRTNDKNKNVAKVGEALKNHLLSYGYEVVHDTGDYEPPRLGTAYSRSLDMLEKRIKNDGEYDIYIDLHRDAYDYTGEDTLTIDGKSVAKVMLVVGTGEGNNGTPILPRPDYKSNYAYAKKITDAVNAQVKGLAKDVRVNKSRYNQHISKRAILVEMGYTGNNLDEVLASVPYLAKAIATTIQT